MASPSSSSGSLDHMASGAIAGFVATAVLHPLDLIKTRMHVQEQTDRGGVRRLPHYRGLLHAFQSIYGIEGWAGFYQGLGANMLGNTASWGVYMYAYNRCKTSFAKEFGIDGPSLYFASATTAGALTTLLLHPIFTVKTRLQLQLRVDAQPRTAVALPNGLLPAAQRDNYAGLVNAVRWMVAEEGLLSLFRGLGPSMLLVSHGSIQFLCYEQAKALLASYRAAAVSTATAADASAGASSSVRIPSDNANDSAKDSAAPSRVPLSTRDLLVASTVSKVCATLGTYPYQVVRSCMQQVLVTCTCTWHFAKCPPLAPPPAAVPLHTTLRR